MRFAKFVATGGAAAAVNVGARWVLQFAVSYEVAVAAAYFVGMVTAFLLARLFVFEATAGMAHREFARFALVNAVAFAQVWLVSVGLARFVFPAIGFAWNAETVAHVCGVVSPVATSYLMHKRFSFRTLAP